MFFCRLAYENQDCIGQIVRKNVSCLLLEIKTKLNKFCTKLQGKQSKLLPSKCTSLLVRTNATKLPAF